MSFFPLPHKAKLYKKKSAPTRDRSGQVVQASEYESTAITISKCLYLGYSGAKTLSNREDFDQLAAFYVEPGVDINEGDRIMDITGVDAFEDGPYEVVSVKKVTDFSGRLHHKSCKLKGVVG